MSQRGFKLGVPANSNRVGLEMGGGNGAYVKMNGKEKEGPGFGIWNRKKRKKKPRVQKQTNL